MIVPSSDETLILTPFVGDAVVIPGIDDDAALRAHSALRGGLTTAAAVLWGPAVC